VRSGLHPSSLVSIVAAVLLFRAAQNALSREVANASHQISALPLTIDRRPP
jgi:hypothetical protein